MILVALSKDELLELLRAARAKRERDWLMILVAYWHGLRASELVALTADSIADGQLTVTRLKKSLATIHPLVEHAEPLLNEKPALFEFARNLAGNQRLFPLTRFRFRQIVREHAITAGLPRGKQKPHVLKHSIVMHIIQPVGLAVTKQYVGHKSINSTAAYLKVTDEEAAAAVQRAMNKSEKL